jgi:hypothetical protein
MRAAAAFLTMLFWMSASPGASIEQSEQMRRALQLHDSGNYAEALAAYNALLEADPKNEAVLYEAGLTARALGDLNACIAYAAEAVATGKRTIMSLALLGCCQDDAGDAKAALKSFERGIALAPRHPEVNYNYALTLARQGKIAESRKHAEISIESDPTRASAYVLYAGILDVSKLDGPAALVRLRFLTLESNTPRASDAAAAIAKRAAEYRKQSEEKKVVLDGLSESSAPDVTLVVLNLAFGLAVATEGKYVPAGASEAARLVHAMQSLLTVATELHETAPDMAFVWKNAAAPLQELSQRELLETFLYVVAELAKLDGAEAWLKDHPKERAQLQSAQASAKRVTP